MRETHHSISNRIPIKTSCQNGNHKFTISAPEFWQRSHQELPTSQVSTDLRPPQVQASLVLPTLYLE